jgi:polyisoprenoid-binding protein YceI
LSCNSSEAPKTDVVETTKVCTFNYNSESTVIGWTAFKFTEKKGVNGIFEKSEVLIANASEDMLQTLAGASFTIPISSINTNNPVRDGKIKNSFFGSMESTEIISGLVKSISDSLAVVEITMNGKSLEYTGTVTTDGLKVGFLTTINMTDFEAQYAIDSLNNVCKVVHTGMDGISKLWSEVDLNVETTLVKTCK